MTRAALAASADHLTGWDDLGLLILVTLTLGIFWLTNRK